MITTIPKEKKINKLASKRFIDTTALYTQNEFSDGVGELNNIKGIIKNKIELPEEFTMNSEPKKIINEQVEYLKNQKPIKLNDKKALAVEKRVEKEFKVDSSTSDRLDHEIYKYELQVTKEKNHANSLFDDIVNRTQQYIKLFNGMSSISIFQNLVGLVARTIAPPPTENEILMIKDRIKRLDPKLITDVYVISQIVQSPELLAYLKSLYDHVKNNVQTNKDLEYILNIVKSVTDYITVNSDKFSMMSSPWLMEAYQKIKGVVFSSPIFAPNTATPAPITTAPTTFNFQSDSTASPTERHSETVPMPRSIGITYEQAQQTPAPQTPAPQTPALQTPAPTNAPLVGNMGTIYEAYVDAFRTREKLETFYNNLLGVGLSRSFMQIKQYIDRYPLSSEEMRTTPTATLTTNLINALIYIGSMPIWVIDELQMRATQINNDPSFFFQPVITSQPVPPTPTQDYNEPQTTTTPTEHRHQLGTATPDEITRDLEYIRNKFNEAFSTNIETMKILYFQILDKSDQILNKYIALYNTLFRLDKLYDIPVEVAPAKLYIINLFNSLNNLNYPILNDFKQMIRAKSDQIINSPNYNVSGALDITPLEGFSPINYIRITPQPTTISKPYDVKPAEYIQPIKAPQYVEQPTALNLSSNVGTVPLNKPDFFKNINQASMTKINKNDSLFDYISNFIFYLPNIFLKKTTSEYKKGKRLYDLITTATPYITSTISLFTIYKASRSLFKKNIRLIQQDEEINPEQLIGIIANKPEWQDYIQTLIGDNRNIRDYFKNPSNMYNFIIGLINNFIQTPTAADAEIAIRDNIIQTLQQELKDVTTKKVVDKLIKEASDKIVESLPKEDIKIEQVSKESEEISKEIIDDVFDDAIKRINKIKPKTLNKELDTLLKQEQSKLNNKVLEELLKKSKEIDLTTTDEKKLEQKIKEQVIKETIKEIEVIKQVPLRTTLFKIENILNLQKSLILLNRLFDFNEPSDLTSKELPFDIFIIYEDYIYPLLISIKANIDNKFSFLNPNDAIDRSKLLKTYFGMHGSTYIFKNLLERIKNIFIDFNIKNTEYYKNNPIDYEIIKTLKNELIQYFERIKLIIPPPIKK